MKTGTFLEYLGDISTEVLVQNLTNTNRHASSIEAIREAVPGGFSLTAEIERTFCETEEEKLDMLADLNAALGKGSEVKEFLRSRPGKLVRIVMVPNRSNEGQF
jgi:hypothetical protein